MEARASMARFSHPDGRTFACEFVPIRDAVRLVTFRAGEGAWDESCREASPSGAIVRVIPVGGAELDRAEAERVLKAEGAQHVWFAPREGKRQAVPDSRKPEPAEAVPVRQLVAELVEKANTRDRERLSAVVEAALDRAGA